MSEVVTATILFVVAQTGRLGMAGKNEPILGGTLVFGVVGLILAYFAFVSEEFEAGIVIRGMSIAMLALALLAAYWPSRPWPH